MKLPDKLFLIHFQTADFYNPESNNLASSTKRGDVLLRCILSTINKSTRRASEIGLWLFLSTKENGNQNSLLIDSEFHLPEDIKNEVQLCKLIQPIITHPIPRQLSSQNTENTDENFKQTESGIKVFTKTLLEAIRMLKEKGYTFVSVEESGKQFDYSGYENLKRENPKIVFILGDQIGISAEIEMAWQEAEVNIAPMALGMMSYLTSQCITILKTIFR